MGEPTSTWSDKVLSLFEFLRDRLPLNQQELLLLFPPPHSSYPILEHFELLPLTKPRSYMLLCKRAVNQRSFSPQFASVEFLPKFSPKKVFLLLVSRPAAVKVAAIFSLDNKHQVARCPCVAVFYSLFLDPWLCVYFVAAGMRELVMYGVRLREQLGSCSNISIYTQVGEKRSKRTEKWENSGGKKKRAMSYFRIPGTHGAHAKTKRERSCFLFQTL